jgi:hypothetical protein
VLVLLLTSPHWIDLIMGLTLLEGVFLVRWRRMRLPTVIAILLPGLFLLLAVREALAGAAWPWVPAGLTGALLAHFFDMWMRFRRASR